MTETSHPEMRLEELLTEQTDRSLGFDEHAEVQKLLRENTAWEADDFELAAAAMMLAFESVRVDAAPALPADLRERVREQAQSIIEEDVEQRVPLERNDTLKTPAARADTPASAKTLEAGTAINFETAKTLVPGQGAPNVVEAAKIEASKILETARAIDPARTVETASGPEPVEAAEDPKKTLELNVEATKIKAAPGPSVDNVVRLWTRRTIILAVAASIAIAVLGYALYATRSPDGVVIPPSPALAQLRETLTKEAGAMITAWSAATDPLGKGVAGDVVWSDAKQSGFMRFSGLAKNDATQSQYQLWIFDADRDERYPVDGGVFDVDRDGEVIVRIDPKIRVSKATLFAVTVERPGGVVVSTRERLVVVAKVL